MTTSGPGREEEAREFVAIVDDDDSVRQSMDRLVRSFGYRTRVFGSGDEFLASTAPEQTACVLLDVRMPGSDGLTVQRCLAERGAGIAVVFVTARATEREERRAWSAGAVGFLRKPVGEAAMRQVLGQAFHAARSARGDRDVE